MTDLENAMMKRNTERNTEDGIHDRRRQSIRGLIAVPLLSACLAASPLAAAVPHLTPTVASAGELDDTIGEAESIAGEIEKIGGELGTSKGRISELNGEIAAGQERQAELRRYLARHVKETYKAGGPVNLLALALSSDSISQFAEMARYAESVSDMYGDALAEQEDEQERLESEYAEITAAKDGQESKLVELKAKKSELDKKVEQLKEKKSEEARKAAVSAESASSAAAATAKAFCSGDTSGWLSGTASAYGGSSDPGCGTRTATGATVSDWSMGVAVPMSMPNYRSYLGRQVEISYGGKSVIATVNDCGGMGGGSRVLDLQPGVFKALGASTCNGWGLRTVKYRFL